MKQVSGVRVFSPERPRKKRPPPWGSVIREATSVGGIYFRL